MNKSQEPLTIEEMITIDVKKLTDGVEYLDSLVYTCDRKSVLEMFRVRNDLQHLSDREIITSAQFRSINKKLEDIGEKFKAKCQCQQEKRKK